MPGPRLGLVLSGGGAAGIAHIPVLQALDDLGLRPAAISGVSIGALMGAAYASGLSGSDLRAHFVALGRKPVAKMWTMAMNGAVGLRSGLTSVNADVFVQGILPDTVPGRIEDLKTPLFVTATRFHDAEAVTFSQGSTRPAVAASLAIPGVFKPVTIDGHIYVDGGVIDNLPLRALPEVDIVLAVNVLTEPETSSIKRPNKLQASIFAVRTMMVKLMQLSLQSAPPDILIVPPIRNFGPAGLWKVEETLAAADVARSETRDAVQRAIAAFERGEQLAPYHTLP